MGNNLGFLYYKKNYDNTTGKVINSMNYSQQITSVNISSFPSLKLTNNKLDTFSAITTYPGLLLGSGYTHYGKEGEKTDTENAFKIGFFFDHTTGMPIIPGSSLKGVLRSVFPQFSKDDLKILNENTTDLPKAEKSLVKAKWITTLIEKLTSPSFNKDKFFEDYFVPKETVTKEELKRVHKFEIELFDTARNVFYDSFPTEIVENNIGNQKKLFGTDSITPHIKEGKTYEEAMLKDPVPLKFLKVLPNVKFDFNFNLKNSTVIKTLNKDKLLLLFQKIILTLGIGAKTNVGYGQFTTNPLTNTIIIDDSNSRKNKDNQYPNTQRSQRDKIENKSKYDILAEKVSSDSKNTTKLDTSVFPEPRENMLHAVIEATIVEVKSGTIVVSPHYKDSENISIQGKTDKKKGEVIKIKPTEKSGKAEKGNLKFIKAALIK